MSEHVIKLLMATHNDHKVQEIRSKLKAEGMPIEVISLKDIKDFEDIAEDGETLSANALQKARTAFERHGLNCFADDTGLEVDALGGNPGVYTARYAGPQCSPEDNRAKMLKEMDGVANRAAKFRTVIALIWNGQEYLFNGEVLGEITTEELGREGFGYDPIFRPSGYEQTFAEMSEADKNKISHRGRAVAELIQFFKGTL